MTCFEFVQPNDILYRTRKGFGVPTGSWFKSGAVTIPERHARSIAQDLFAGNH